MIEPREPANKRAFDLLLTYLDSDQQRSLKEYGYIFVHGKRRWWKFGFRSHYLIWSYGDYWSPNDFRRVQVCKVRRTPSGNYKIAWFYCVYPQTDYPLPWPDKFLIFRNMIMFKEAKFLVTANRFSRSSFYAYEFERHFPNLKRVK